MSTSEPAPVHSPSTAGPTIEWLEPKLPDILKNGSSSLGSFTTGEGPLEGNRLELSSPESCNFSGVRLGEGRGYLCHACCSFLLMRCETASF